MPDFPLLDGQRATPAGIVSATSSMTEPPNMGTANTKSAWGEFIASTPHAANGLLLRVTHSTAVARNWFIDIGIGAESAEIVLIPDLLYTNAQAAAKSVLATWYFPVHIPAGARLSVRGQTQVINSEPLVGLTLLGGGLAAPVGFQRVFAMGPDLTDSGGTEIDPGASLNTKGAWVQLIASTPYPAFAFAFATGDKLNSGRTTATWLLDFAIGGSGSEVAIITDYPLSVSADTDAVTPKAAGALPIQIPAGVRISARAQSSTDEATDRLFDLVAYGIG